MYRNQSNGQNGRRGTDNGSAMGRGSFPNLMSVIRRQRPVARAVIRGSELYPHVRGNVQFYQTAYGTLVVAELTGLPHTDIDCEGNIFGFHIHEGGSCSGNAQDPFSNALSHYNPYGCLHPYHAGDLPPLFGADGYAFSAFLTGRFEAEQVIGKTVIVHSSPDDFVTQPSGNSGAKIACGEIIG